MLYITATRRCEKNRPTKNRPPETYKLNHNYVKIIS